MLFEIFHKGLHDDLPSAEEIDFSVLTEHVSTETFLHIYTSLEEILINCFWNFMTSNQETYGLFNYIIINIKDPTKYSKDWENSSMSTLWNYCRKNQVRERSNGCLAKPDPTTGMRQWKERKNFAVFYYLLP